MLHATIRNKAFDGAGNNNIRVSGGTISTFAPECIGRHLAFEKVTSLVVDGTRLLAGVGDWSAYFGLCEFVQISGVYVNNDGAIKSDGLHFISCLKVTVEGCIVICGDDAVSLTQPATPGGQDPLPYGTDDFTLSTCFLVESACECGEGRNGAEHDYGHPEGSVCQCRGAGRLAAGS